MAIMRSLADLVREALAEIEEISPDEVRALLDRPGRDGWHIVDVREADEFEAGHLPGARHYPRGFLEVRADLEHPKRDPWLADRSRKLVLYCGGGHRSALAAQALRRMGFSELRSMAGGFTAWSRRGHPTDP
jgi:rhodanese-related sulfurtransferase